MTSEVLREMLNLLLQLVGLLSAFERIQAATGGFSTTPSLTTTTRRESPFPVNIPAFSRLSELPGATLLQEGVRNGMLNITMVPGTVQAVVNGETLLHVTAPVYKDDGSDSVYLFGPTLRLKAGDSYRIRLTNDLVNTESTSDLQRDLGDTNIHTHGLHSNPGKYNQDPTDETTNGDNIFLTLKGKTDTDQIKANVLELANRVPEDHLPGVQWYHPHKHHSTAGQTFSASGLVVVEDDPKWLPDSNGCEEIRSVLETAPDVLLHLSLMTFKPPQTGGMMTGWNDANIQLVDEEGNSPLCCSDDSKSKTALYGTGSALDLAFVNGAWKPTIPLKAGEWQRWRFVMTGFKRFMSIQIVDDSNNVADDCEMQLVAKDGVYPMQIPRYVSYILIPSGGRSEVLVRCKYAKSKNYKLVSGREPYPFGSAGGGGMGGGGMGGGGGGMGGGGGGMIDHSFKQDPIAYIKIDAGKSQTSLKQKACTPLRPDYAPDLRDANLKATGANKKIVTDPRATFEGSPVGCTIGGEKFTFPDKNPLSAPMGSVVEWDWFMLWNHPLHLHTNPFQIFTLPSSAIRPGTSWTEYFEVGDYHDTLFLPMVRGSSIPVRFQPGPYFGYSVVHCHFLQHEDAGCMKVVEWKCPPGDTGNKTTGMCSNRDAVPVKGTYRMP